MKRVGVLLGTSLLLFAALLSFTGCSGLECGEGAVEQDGECVMVSDLEGQCEYGQIRDGDECYDPDDYCGEGTEYRAGRGTCMAEFPELECGEGAEQDGDRCVAPEPVECGDHTHQLDPWLNECVARSTVCQGGTIFTVREGEEVCLPSEDVCGDDAVFVEETHLCMPAYDCRPGDVVIDGHCMPEAVELAEDIEFEAQGNTNPEFGGEAVEVDIDGVGQMAVFGGTIGTPEDLNEDGELNQIIDVYEFEAEEGDWFEISVQSLGIPNPAFMVLSGDEEQRLSPLTGYRDKMRQITITEDGTYYLAVLPEVALTGADALVGDSDWDYVGTLELIETPEASEHDFGEENLEQSLGRLDDNFVFVDQYEEGEVVEFHWETQPSHAEPVVTAWADEDDFIDEYRDSAFALEVPEGGEFYLIFEWDVIRGTTGLDYEIWGQEWIDIPVGDEFSQEFSADDGDVLKITQMNHYFEPVTVTVTDEDQNTIVDDSITPGDIARYIGLEGGDYTATFANPSTAHPVEDFIAYIDVGIQTEVTTLDRTYSGTANEHVSGEHDYFLLQFDDTTDIEVTLAHTGGNGWARLFIYGIGEEQLYRGDVEFSDSEYSTIFEFEADTPYIVAVGNDELSWAAYFDYELDFRNVEAYEEDESTSTTVSVEEGDILEVGQDNLGGEAVSVEVVDDGGETVVEESLIAGEMIYEYGLEEGEYTVTFENDSGERLFDFEMIAHSITPVEVADFSAEEGDEVRITQDNDGDTEVEILIADSNGDVVYRQFLGTSEALYFDVEDDDEYTLSYFQPGQAQEDQEVEGIEVVIDFFEISTLATFAVEEGDVVEVHRLVASTEPDVDLTLVDDDTGEANAEESVGHDGVMRYVGVENSGEWNLVVSGFGAADRDLEDYGLTYEVIAPAVITDTAEVYEGQDVSDADFGPQDYYVLELDETTTYELELNVTEGFGYGRIFIYGLGDDLLEHMDDAVGTLLDSQSGTVEFEFEADTPYIIRIGNDTDDGDIFDYELTFE